ncbi:MAG: thiamine-phosphate pyrophosphorylase [Cyclobacteriaceae bacterium]|jgi:thiamine-phosphate pyrophosphorylase
MEVKANKNQIKSGIYLVIDPSMDEEILLNKLQIILAKEIAAVQIWDNFSGEQNIEQLIQKIHSLCAQHQTLVFINNRWEYLKGYELDGVHFDLIPVNLEDIRKQINKDIIFGLTCGNDLDKVRWAAKHNIDYISFCSMFPSSSISNCEIINYETVKEASSIFNKPIFLAGGIYPKNLNQLDNLKYDGIAVISGIMNSEHPDKVIDEYHQNLKLTK